MTLLLDTHTVIWFLEDNARLSKSARAAIMDPGNRCCISDATAWEVGIKHALGKLELPLPYTEIFPDWLVLDGFQMLPIQHKHLYRLISLAWHHRDPFDRLLIAQALVEGLTIVTRDPHFAAYGVPLLW